MGIVFMNKTDIFSMLAWGQSGGTKEYKRRHKNDINNKPDDIFRE